MSKKQEKKAKQEEKPKPAPVRLVIQNGTIGVSSKIKQQEKHNG